MIVTHKSTAVSIVLMATMLATACSKSSLPSDTTVDGATTTAPSPSAAKQETKTLIRFINVRRRPAFGRGGISDR